MRILGTVLVYVFLASRSTTELPAGTRIGCFDSAWQLIQHFKLLRTELRNANYDGIRKVGPNNYLATWVDVVPSGERQYQLRYHLESCGSSQQDIVVDAYYPVYLFRTRIKR